MPLSTQDEHGRLLGVVSDGRRCGEKQDAPVALELAVPAGLAVDCLAGALGRGAAVGGVVVGGAGDGGCAATDEAVDGRTGLLVAGDGGGRWLGVVVGHVGVRCKALGVVGSFSRAARIGQLSNANPSFSSHQTSRRLMPGVPTRSTAAGPLHDALAAARRSGPGAATATPRAQPTYLARRPRTRSQRRPQADN